MRLRRQPRVGSVVPIGRRLRPSGARLRAAAFTLIELLVVTAILGLVIAVIGACIAAGLKVWDQARSFHVSEIDGFVGLDIIEKDVSNTFCFRGVPLSGAGGRLSFATLLTPDSSGGQGKGASSGLEARASDWRIGTVQYVLDASRGELLRQEWAYSPSQRAPETLRSERLMSGVNALSFSYLSSSKGSAAPEVWQPEWNSATNLPVAVRVTVKGRDADRPFVMERLILLPLAAVRNAGEVRP